MNKIVALEGYSLNLGPLFNLSGALWCASLCCFGVFWDFELMAVAIIEPLSDQFLNFGLRNSRCMWTAWLPTALEIFAFALMYS